MGIPDWVWRILFKLSDEELLEKVLSRDSLGGYATWVLQERQAVDRDRRRRRKMLAKINRFFRARRLEENQQRPFRTPW